MGATAQDALRGERRLWGAALGRSVALLPTLRVDGGFGYFQRRRSAPGDELPPASSKARRCASFGTAARRARSSAPSHFDRHRCADDATVSTPSTAQGRALALEGVTLVQRLRRFEEPGRRALGAGTSGGAVRLGARPPLGHARRAQLAQLGVRAPQRRAPGAGRDAAAQRPRALGAGGLARRQRHAARARTWSRASSSACACPRRSRRPARCPASAKRCVAAGQPGSKRCRLGQGACRWWPGRLARAFRRPRAWALALFGEYQRDPNRVAFAESLLGGDTRFRPSGQRLARVVRPPRRAFSGARPAGRQVAICAESAASA